MTAVSSERIVSDYLDLPDSVLTAESVIFSRNLDLLWDTRCIQPKLQYKKKKAYAQFETRLLLGLGF